MILHGATAKKRGRGLARGTSWQGMLLLGFFFAAFLPAQAQAAGPRIVHVVVIWLKRPGNVHDEHALVRASKEFEHIAGVLRVQAGPGMGVTRPGMEQAFDIGVVMIFKNRKALERFAHDERHVLAIQRLLKPLAERYLVYNFVLE
jgi:hypothetical protein